MGDNKKKLKKLQLSRETIRSLQDADLKTATGGGLTDVTLITTRPILTGGIYSPAQLGGYGVFAGADGGTDTCSCPTSHHC
jgi:hypothetical protein